MTCHWIDKDFSLQNVVLGCFLHEGESTSDEVLDDFAVKLFQECGFDNLNISAVVTDTTGNMNLFGQMLEDLKIPHIYCTDHVLHLSARKAFYLKNTASCNSYQVMKKVKDLVKHFHLSPKNTDELCKAQKSLKEIYCRDGKKPVRVIMDVVTRWWSTYDSVERVIYLRKAFSYLELNGKLEGKFFVVAEILISDLRLT